MTVDFIRFNAGDGVELHGWLSDGPGDTAVVHVHGMSGNGYENVFLDGLRELYSAHGISFFPIDTRGRGIISDFRQGDGWKHAGSCFEIFEESVHDIDGALGYLRSVGKTKFILQGHSLGCTKVINYMVTQRPADVTRVILLAPTDMAGWAATDPRHQAFLERARSLAQDGQGETLVDPQCWEDLTPISAQTYPTICEAGSAADIYGEREGGPLLGRIEVPMLIPYGDKDIGIGRIDGTIERWLGRVNAFKHANTTLAVVPGATHGFRGFEQALADAVEAFIV